MKRDGIFEESIENIAYFQFKIEECLDLVDKVEIQILNNNNDVSPEWKLMLLSRIEDLKLEINDIILSQIYAIKKINYKP